MNVILLSGGSGKRLWPLSNDIRSKQFIRLFRAPEGGYESMVQRVYRQLRQADPKAQVTIATSKAQVSALRNQLGEDIGISVEPCRRDTFPAIALATAYLRDVRGVDENEPVVVCPVDPYVDEGYFAMLRQLSEAAQAGQASLVLMGIEPTYPSEKYGYIIPKDAGPQADVLAFKEKPDAETAAQYIARGALWNGGVFAYRLGYVLDRAQALLGDRSYRQLLQRYDTLKPISFDYAVAERESSIRVLRYSGAWKDIGTWNTLTEAMDQPTVGQAILGKDCQSVYVINELNLPILTMGLQNVVVAASPEGILISERERSSYIKPYVEALDQQVMFAEKSWGSFRVIDVGRSSLTIRVTLNPGHRMNYHRHFHRDETWTVVSGTGKAILDGSAVPLSPGVSLTMRAGCPHTVLAESELVLIEVQTGEAISAEDKEKLPWPELGD